MSYHNGMTIEEIADASMYHSRWDEDHRSICEDCYSDWYDAMQDMAHDAKLDAMAEAEGVQL